MKIELVVRMIICLLLLSQYQTFAARSLFPVVMELWDAKGRRGDGQEQVPQWWSEDYSLPRRRQPVHNKLGPSP